MFDLVRLHTLVFVFIDGLLFGFIGQLHVLAKHFCNHVKCSKSFLFLKVYSQKQAEKIVYIITGSKRFLIRAQIYGRGPNGYLWAEPSVERCFFVMMQIMLRNKLTKLRFNCKENKSKQQLNSVD